MTLDRRNDIAFNIMAFPFKLYSMLEDADAQGFADVISWQPGGKSFKVHQTSAFSKTIMKSYFAQTKFKSFQRQLNIYGWKKVPLGPNKGGYMHVNFIRGQPELCDLIVRRKDVKIVSQKQPQEEQETSKTTGSKTPAVMEELSFSMLDPRPLKQGPGVLDFCNNPQDTKPVALSESEVKSFYDFFYPYPPQQQQPLAATRALDDALTIDDDLFALEVLPPPPTQDQSVVAPKQQSAESTFKSFSSMTSFNLGNLDEVADLDTFISLLNDQQQEQDDHEMDPCSSALCGVHDGVDVVNHSILSSADEEQLDATELSFPFKLHLMLENAERDNYAHIVSWVNDGSAFKVHDNHAFVDQVMPNFFDQSKYESFRRQLNLYQFHRVSRGEERGIISHPCFQRGARHWCKDITRRKSEDSTITMLRLPSAAAAAATTTSSRLRV